MASTSSTRSESPVDIDFSVIRTSIQMGHKMIDQILNGIHYGSEEVRNLLREECDFIMECKVCRNLFRSFPNFVAHKRVYCMEFYEEKLKHENLAPEPVDEETVMIQPKAPEESDLTNTSEIVRPKNISVASSNIEKAISKTFDGKSKEYKFYTKVAEDMEKRKFTKVTNTVTLTPIATTSNAVLVSHAKGDKSAEAAQASSPKKQSPAKSNDNAKTGSPAKKNSVLAVCADLAKKKLLQDGEAQASTAVNALPLSTRTSARCRKSSPRKSIEYLDTQSAGSKGCKSVNTQEDMDFSDGNEDIIGDNSRVTNDKAIDNEWLKFCDVKRSLCKICRKSFTSLNTLKFHANMKHVRSSAKYACPICEGRFEYISTLARHLRRTHHKSDAYVSNIRMKLRGRKSPEPMDTNQEDSSSSSSGANQSPQKDTKNMLSFSTGWKKCDKCGKVCWKAKSFYRHYNTCKGPASKPNSSAPNSPVKSGKQLSGNGSQKSSTALLKLQEKLRAGVIQSSSTEISLKTKPREHVSKSESEKKSSIGERDKNTSERSFESMVATHTELYKALTKPVVSDTEESRPRPSNQDVRESCTSKSYNLRPASQVNDQEVRESDKTCQVEKGVICNEKEANDKNKEILNNNGSPAFKKLEERLVREAGLKEHVKVEKQEAPTKTYGTRHSSHVKNDAMITKEALVVETKEATRRIRKISSDFGKEDILGKMKEQRVVRESPEIKQLEEKLTSEVSAKPYGTRHAIASQTKSHAAEAKEASVNETRFVTGRVRKLSSEIGKEDNVSKVKEQRALRESPEIKQLEEKLTREAFGHNKNTENKESVKKFQTSKKEEIQPSEKRKSLNKETEELKEATYPESENESKGIEMVETRKCSKRTSSREAEIRKERISEQLREKIASQEKSVHECKARSSRSESRDSDSKTPEKMKLMTNISPVSSPGPFLPSSPTPSVQSNSSYNMKFKMTVQEMAELVESASLTKFAKERKKRARNILNTKQVKESQKTAAALSKPMKKKIRKRNIVIRNVYGTRNKMLGTSASADNQNVHYTRFSGGRSSDGANGKNITSSKSSTEGDVSSRDSSRERQNEIKRLSREQKRLQNSAGFVEKNFYTMSSSRDSSKDRQSETDTEKGRLSREIKRLENSEGFVDKGLQYESDSSVDRERRSIGKLSKVHDSIDGSSVCKEQSKVEESTHPLITKSQEINVSTKTLPEKSSVQMAQGNTMEETSEQGKEKSKQQNTVNIKKTVLYVDKDFSEQIKNIQQKRSNDYKSSASVTETEQICEKHEEMSVKEHFKPSKAFIESHAPQRANIQEEKNDKSSEMTVPSKETTGETGIKGEQKDSPKHRTRLATGSIFFDSELLKLSPSKAEKKAAELSKGNEANKDKLEKSRKSGVELTLVKKKLSLSPKRKSDEVVSLHQRTKSGPQRFSLLTGVKQCQKCSRNFWKKKAYVNHLINSTCSDKKVSRLDRKRALSLSPEGKMLEEGKFESSKANIKKAKTEAPPSEKSTEKNADALKVNISQKPDHIEKDIQKAISKETCSSSKTLKKIVDRNNEFNEKVNTGEKDKLDSNENRKTLRTSVMLGKDRVGQNEDMLVEERSLRKREATNLSQNNAEHVEQLTKREDVIRSHDKSKGIIEENLDNRESEEKSNKNLRSKVDEISYESKNEEIVLRSKLKKQDAETSQVSEADSGNGKNDDRGSVQSEIAKLEKELFAKQDLSSVAEVTPKVRETLYKVSQVSGNSSSVPQTMITEEVPGPSTSLSSVFSDDSDDNASDFSGFSEDDLLLGEQELSQMEIVDNDHKQDDIEDEDIGCEDDLVEVSDDASSDDEKQFNFKPDNQSASTSQRPIRKSAQNRFAHVEEIWVYKEPGKPIVEKTKGVKNREYVIDVTNPSKLQCHNSKDVDRLIDEKGLKCRQCETPCTSISNLRRHVIRHLGWKRYKCKHCSYTCYDMSYCRQHVLRAHGENLTNKNFNKFIIDLKKEATKKRAAKRTSTLHKSKQNSMDDETYKKPKTPGTSSAVGQKAINQTEQAKSITHSSYSPRSSSNTGQTAKASNLKDIRKTPGTVDKTVTESSKVVAGGFIAKAETGSKTSAVRKDTAKGERKNNADESPLGIARMNLAKALKDN